MLFQPKKIGWLFRFSNTRCVAWPSTKKLRWPRNQAGKKCDEKPQNSVVRNPSLFSCKPYNREKQYYLQIYIYYADTAIPTERKEIFCARPVLADEIEREIETGKTKVYLCLICNFFTLKDLTFFNFSLIQCRFLSPLWQIGSSPRDCSGESLGSESTEN